ncbi:MAG: MarR family transcriptional regulator [Paludisphaera borealis]|uniref:MarR family winged helix-turn-helix transcriptional regulator n=1 Tax=Paludisphaera borealis TaxID=1387353 RepID=UPI0028455433|nr:MarR family transcriptional regulator [Paludisphaera borealis]MDR3619080.1 MarR family transcriptional regulator [Paludisphaera borealis]
MSPARKPPQISLPVLNDDPRGWEVKVAVAVLQFHGRLERRMSEALSPHGVTLAQYDVLMTLWHGDGITQQELAERLLVTKANVVGLIDRVGAAGWVERRPDPCDRRANRLYLTDAGRKLAIEAQPGQFALVRKIFGGLSEEELQQMHAFLERLNGASTECG